MRLQGEIEIHGDRETVWAAFNNGDNVRRWQSEIQSIELVSGEYLELGAESRIVYRDGGREYTIREHVTERRAPEFLALHSGTAFGTAVGVTRLESLDDGTTRWAMYVNHPFHSLMRLVGPFFRTACLRRIGGYTQRFKLMVESDVREGEL